MQHSSYIRLSVYSSIFAFIRIFSTYIFNICFPYTCVHMYIHYVPDTCSSYVPKFLTCVYTCLYIPRCTRTRLIKRMHTRACMYEESCERVCAQACSSLHMHRSSLCPLCTPYVESYPSFLWLSCHAASPASLIRFRFQPEGPGEPPWRATDEECNRDSGYPRANRGTQRKRERQSY